VAKNRKKITKISNTGKRYFMGSSPITAPVKTDESWFHITPENKAAGKPTEIFLFGEIGMFGITASDFIAELDKLGDVKNLLLRINSPGGSIFDGNAIFNHLSSMCKDGCQMDAQIESLAASMVTVIATAVNGKITIYENAFFMIHNPMAWMGGDAKDFRREAKLLEDMKDSAIKSYQRKSGLSRDEISQMMDDETFMTAKEALEKGFVDEIIDLEELDDDEPNNFVNFGDLKVPDSVYASVMMINTDKHYQVIKPANEFTVFRRTVEEVEGGKKVTMLWGSKRDQKAFEPQSILYSPTEWKATEAKMHASNLNTGDGSQVPLFPSMIAGKFQEARKAKTEPKKNNTFKIAGNLLNFNLEDLMKLRFDAARGWVMTDDSGVETVVMTLEQAKEQGFDVTKEPSASDKERAEALVASQIEARKSGVNAERQRMAAIMALDEKFDIGAELKTELLGDGTEEKPGLTLAEATNRVLEEVGKGLVTVRTVEPVDASGNVVIVVEEKDKKMAGMVNALLVRGGVEKEKEKVSEARASAYSGYGLQQFTRECLSIDGLGEEAFRLSDQQLVQAFRESLYGGQTYAPKMAFSMNTSTLQSVLNTNANAALLKTLEESPMSFERLVKPGELKNVKTADLYTNTNAPDVLEIPEGGAPKLSKVDDKKEQTKLTKFGRAWSMTEEMLINDELSALTDSPSKFGKAMKRIQNRDYYTQILATNGPTLANGGNFFQAVAAHNNLTAPGGALNKTSLRTAYKLFLKFRLETPDDNRTGIIYANIAPKFLIVGPDNTDLAADLTTNQGDPDTGVNMGTKNLFGPGQMWSLIPVSDAQFLENDSNAWLLGGNPMDMDICMHYTLTGCSTPQIDSAVARAGEAKGITFDIVHFWVNKFLDWKGYVRNNGGA